MTIEIEVHIDTLCPWCYVQKRCLDSAMARFQVRQPGAQFRVAYKPFYINRELESGPSRFPFP